ncbi:hypothetical protein ACEPAG_9440 [Sanghuangporus baumii]
MPEGADVHKYLNDLRMKHETLAQSGVTITDSDYRSTIISCLPHFLANFASSQLTSAKIVSHNLLLLSQTPPTPDQLERAKYVDPKILIHIIVDEAERQKWNKRGERSAKLRKQPRDKALAVSHFKPFKQNVKHPPQEPKLCWTCGQAGHFRWKCPKNKGGFLKQGGGKQYKLNDSANVAYDSDSDGVWDCVNAAWDWSDDEEDNPPMKSTESSQESQAGTPDVEIFEMHDWDLLADVFKPEEGLKEEPLWHSDDKSEQDESDCEEAEVVMIHPDCEPKGRRVIFDSGSIRYISPYRNNLTKYEDIPPRALYAINKQVFHATGQGNMAMPIPNGSSEIVLTNVLYSPDIQYTLISVGELDKARHKMRFGEGKCRIFDPFGAQIGEIAHSPKGLYKFISEPVETNLNDKINLTRDGITAMELHAHMSHISPRTAEQIITKGLVTGIHLIPSDLADQLEGEELDVGMDDSVLSDPTAQQRAPITQTLSHSTSNFPTSAAEPSTPMVATQPQSLQAKSSEPCNNPSAPGEQRTGVSPTITDNSASLRRSGCTRAPSAYMKRLTTGEGTQMQWKRDGIIPKGMRMAAEEDDIVAV